MKTLYENAETHVMINGFLSSPYKITRGVRQGDPLSCLLFDLAIEPLAASIRASHLKGYNIPGAEDRLIATLFADDTTTFLNKEDKFTDLVDILDVWCTASGAKFNKEKTEVIPIGQPEYRKHLLDTWKPTPNSKPLPDYIKIARDGEAIRILGAWHGNETNELAIWTPTLEKIDATLARWQNRKLTMAGRKLIVQMCIGGMTQYLTKVQGMPKHIEKCLEKRIHTFLWADKTQSPVNADMLHAPVSIGRKAALDIAARNEAIEITWAKEYLHFGPDCPTWALVADEILVRGTSQAESRTPKSLRVNMFLQSWKPMTTAIPTRLKETFKTTKKYGLRREGIAFSRDILRDMPIWQHGEADPKLHRLNHSIASKCLHDNHKVLTVGDTEYIANLASDAGHSLTRHC